MIKLIISFVLGFLFAFLLRLIVINVREKKGLNEVKYKSLPLTSKMKIIIREIIFKFSIQRFNRDFLLNLKNNDQVIMQVMHRSHFPEVVVNASDLKFGLAIYIPIKPLNSTQKNGLIKILKEESESFEIAQPPIEYFVIDAGSRVRYTGYLIARIIKEIFKLEDVDVELFDEGILPYHYLLRIPKGVN